MSAWTSASRWGSRGGRGGGRGRRIRRRRRRCVGRRHCRRRRRGRIVEHDDELRLVRRVFSAAERQVVVAGRLDEEGLELGARDRPCAERDVVVAGRRNRHRRDRAGLRRRRVVEVDGVLGPARIRDPEHVLGVRRGIRGDEEAQRDGLDGLPGEAADVELQVGAVGRVGRCPGTLPGPQRVGGAVIVRRRGGCDVGVSDRREGQGRRGAGACREKAGKHDQCCDRGDVDPRARSSHSPTP